MTAEIDRRVEELASKQLGHFSVRQVLLHQGTMTMVRRRRESGRWQSRGYGVLALLGTPDSFDRRVIAAVLAAPCPAFASHRCAATLLGLPGYGERLELTVRRTSELRRPGLEAHRSNLLPDHHVTVVNCVPVTTVARTLFDLSAVVRPQRLARTVDTALARRMVTLMDLSGIARDLGVRGRRRSTAIRQILLDRGDDFAAPETEIEQEFVDLIAGSVLPQPDRQVTLGDSDGVIGRVDFLHRRARLVIETDGREHHTSLLDRQAAAM